MKAYGIIDAAVIKPSIVRFRVEEHKEINLQDLFKSSYEMDYTPAEIYEITVNVEGLSFDDIVNKIKSEIVTLRNTTNNIRGLTIEV